MENKILYLLYKEGYVNKSNIVILQEGLKRIKNFITDFGLAIMISGIMGNVLAGAMMQIMYTTLRCYAGGYHASNEKKCRWLSWFSMIICLVFINSDYLNNIRYTIFHLLTFLSSISIIVLSPVESINKPLIKREKEVFNKRSNIIVVFMNIAYFFALIKKIRILIRVIGCVLIEVFIGMLISILFKKLQTERIA